MVIWSVFCDKQKMSQAIKISLFVGTILNLINQGDFLLHAQFAMLNFPKLILTYFVPFCVSTYTAISIGVQMKIGEKMLVSSTIECKKCHTLLFLRKDEIIPPCPACGMNGVWKISKQKDIHVF